MTEVGYSTFLVRGTNSTKNTLLKFFNSFFPGVPDRATAGVITFQKYFYLELS